MGIEKRNEEASKRAEALIGWARMENTPAVREQISALQNSWVWKLYRNRWAQTLMRFFRNL